MYEFHYDYMKRKYNDDKLTLCYMDTDSLIYSIETDDFYNKTNDLILNLTPENVTQHSRIVTTTRKGSSTPTKMSKIIGRQIYK